MADHPIDFLSKQVLKDANTLCHRYSNRGHNNMAKENSSFFACFDKKSSSRRELGDFNSKLKKNVLAVPVSNKRSEATITPKILERSTMVEPNIDMGMKSPAKRSVLTCSSMSSIQSVSPKMKKQRPNAISENFEISKQEANINPDLLAFITNAQKVFQEKNSKCLETESQLSYNMRLNDFLAKSVTQYLQLCNEKQQMKINLNEAPISQQPPQPSVTITTTTKGKKSLESNHQNSYSKILSTTKTPFNHTIYITQLINQHLNKWLSQHPLQPSNLMITSSSSSSMNPHQLLDDLYVYLNRAKEIFLLSHSHLMTNNTIEEFQFEITKFLNEAVLKFSQIRFEHNEVCKVQESVYPDATPSPGCMTDKATELTSKGTLPELASPDFLFMDDIAGLLSFDNDDNLLPTDLSTDLSTMFGRSSPWSILGELDFELDDINVSNTQNSYNNDTEEVQRKLFINE